MTYDQNATNAEAKKQAATEEAANVKDTALGAGQDVKDSALSEAADLKDHAVDRAQDLFGQSREQVGQRIAQGQGQIAATVREFSDELRDMAHGSQNGGYASEIAAQIAQAGHQVATYLDRNEPGDVVDEVRRFAARRPLAFLGIAAAAGLVAGRVARGVQASSQGVVTGGSQRQKALPGSQPTFPSERSSFAGQTHPAAGQQDLGRTEGTGFGAQHGGFGRTEGLGQGAQHHEFGQTDTLGQGMGQGAQHPFDQNNPNEGGLR